MQGFKEFRPYSSSNGLRAACDVAASKPWKGSGLGLRGLWVSWDVAGGIGVEGFRGSYKVPDNS